MRVPPSQPQLAPVYLNMLQARNARPPQAAAPADAATPRPAEPAVPRGGARPTRGSLIDIKA
jgi:hypothetical protein